MTYNSVTSEVIAALDRAAPGRVVAGADVNPDYAKDEMPIYGSRMPEVSIDVLSTEEVSAIMKVCYEHSIPVTTRGAGTGLVGGATPIFGGIVICTARMNRIINIDTDNFVMRVQAGALLKDVHEAALSRGLMYPPDPGEKLSTVGGNASTNAGGMRAIKYGTTKDYVRGMTVVLANGDVLELGSGVAKSSTGYNMMQLITGSEGTLGIITELVLKLVPAPKATISVMVPFEELEACVATVPKLFASSFRPTALEFFEKDILVVSEEYIGRPLFPREIDGRPVGAYLMMILDGDSADELDPIVENIMEFMFEEGAMEVLVADTAPRIKDIWSARSSFLESLSKQYRLLDENDVVVPVTKIVEYVAFFNELCKRFDFKAMYFGHAGDGNLHIYTVSNDMSEDDFKQQVHEFMLAIYEKTYLMGGELSGEHEIGMGKAQYYEDVVGIRNIELQRGIKRAFDPKLILNPGKVCFKPEDMADAKNLCS
ncbi:MAG: FAD-binding protein [Defluviitaleaceae bacterium]|nr:FAD-binding protein [Defluviitaleaceae bacterium]